MKQKKSREEREMEALMKKLRKGKPVDSAPKSRYVDPTGAQDEDIRNMEADALFREMKRRDF